MISSCYAKSLVAAAFAATAFISHALASPLSQPGWTGVVTYVVDGDTVRVRPTGGEKPISVRIDGIDAPEICQSGGLEARAALERRVLGKSVVILDKTRDDYGRLVGRVVLNQQDQGKWLVRQGLAWSYRYRNNPGPYARQERQAKSAGAGMFAPVHAQAPVYPREFRQLHGSCYARYR